MELSQSHSKYQSESQLRLAGPLYLQVAAHMKERITAGEWALNEPLPNEQDLSANYRVSLGTMRKALELLTRQNLVVRHQGRGTFVQEHRTAQDRVFWPLMFTAKPAAAEAIDVSLISSEIVQASSELASRFSIQLGSPVIRLTCFTTIETAAKSIDTIVAPSSTHPAMWAELQAKPEHLPASFIDLMETVVRCSDRVMASVVDASQTELLKVQRDSPILSIERRAFDWSDRLVMIITRAIVTKHSVDYAMQV